METSEIKLPKKELLLELSWKILMNFLDEHNTR